MTMKKCYMNILVLIYILLYLLFGLAHKYFWVNCLIGVMILIIIIINIIPNKKNNIANILSSIFLLVILIVLTFYNILLMPPQIVNSKNDIILDISDNERLKIVRHGDMRISDTGSLYYEKDLLLGFKYMIEINNNIDLKEKIDTDYYLKIFHKS